MQYADGAGSSQVAWVRPDLLVVAADRFAAVADVLEADAATVPAWAPAAGFASAVAAAELDADLLAAVHGHAGRARALGHALRAAAVAWRTADDAVAATFTR